MVRALILLVGLSSAVPIADIANVLLTVSHLTKDCPAETFVDPSNPSEERKAVSGDCGFWVDKPVCPEGWVKLEVSSWKWCSWGRHRYDTSCVACSVQRTIIPKQTLATCDQDPATPCWLGFQPNDLPPTFLNNRLGGLWYMDGNPYPEEAITFHGATWSSDNLEASVAIYKENNWAMHASPIGDLQNTLVHEFGAGLKFCIEPVALTAHSAADNGIKLATASITSEVDWAQATTDTLLGDWLGLVMELTATDDPDVILRTGTSPYTLRRFVDATGQKTKQWPIWRADVLGELRPDTKALRALGPMPDLWLNEKIVPLPACPGCK